MDFHAFDHSEIDAFAEEAKARWGDTAAYREYERKTAGQSKEALREAGEELTALLDPAAFTGLAERQCETFLREEIRPMLKANADSLGAAAEINV